MFSLELTQASAHHLLTACAFFLGCCIGSFMNVVVWRLPRGESLVYPPSHCPKCNHLIRPWENIPIISWLCLRARCSSCHQPISVKYPLGEAATGLLFTALWLSILHHALPLTATPAIFYLGASLLAASLIDIDHHIIPDEITIAGMLIALLFAVAFPQGRIECLETPRFPHILHTGIHAMMESHLPVLAQSRTLHAVVDCISGAIFGLFPLLSIGFSLRLLLPHKGNSPRSPEAAVGGGDLKLMAMVGAFLGPDLAIIVILFASVLGLIWWPYSLIIGKCNRFRLPLAPFISIAVLILILIPDLPFRLAAWLK